MNSAQPKLTPPQAFAATFVLAAFGGAVFGWAGLPAGWLSGSMIAVAVAALFGLEATIPALLRNAVFVVLGVSMGAGVTPDLIAQMPAWPLTLLGLAAATVLVTSASYVFLRRFARWDAPTAYFASIPGALTVTLAVAETSPADMRLVSLAQTIRLFMLVAVLPLLVAAADNGGSPAITPIEQPYELALLTVAGVGGAILGSLSRIPGGLLLGAFVASSLLHVSGQVDGQVPDVIQLPAFAALGAMLGLRFSGTGWRELAGMLAAGVGSFVVATVTSVTAAVLVAAAVGMPGGQLLLAFAPGGLEVMVILAFVLAADPAFVAAHHLARFLGIMVVVPLVAPFIYGSRSAYATKVERER